MQLPHGLKASGDLTLAPKIKFPAFKFYFRRQSTCTTTAREAKEAWERKGFTVNIPLNEEKEEEKDKEKEDEKDEDERINSTGYSNRMGKQSEEGGGEEGEEEIDWEARAAEFLRRRAAKVGGLYKLNPVDPWLESAWCGDSTPLNRKCDVLVSEFAFTNGSTCAVTPRLPRRRLWRLT
jgi:hypothetical protein